MASATMGNKRWLDFAAAWIALAALGIWTHEALSPNPWVEFESTGFLLVLNFVIVLTLIVRDRRRARAVEIEQAVFRKSAAEHQAEAKRLHDILESAPDAIVVVDADGKIHLASARTESLFGYRRDELIGQGMEVLLPRRLRGQHEGHRKGFFRDPTFRAMGSGLDLLGARKDGTEFPVEISLSPIRGEQGTLVASAIRDVSQRKAIEADLAGAMSAALAARDEAIAARAEAVAANNAKSDFLSRMSHELRTPLNAILGFAQMLKIDRQGSLTPKQKEYVHHIFSAGDHLLSLVNDLLDLAIIEADRIQMSIERVVVADVFASVRATMSPLAARAGVIFDVSPATNAPDIRADALRLLQVLINLLSNAIKYNREGGSVALNALPTPDGMLRLVVADTGIGIPLERQSELFEPFKRGGAEYTTVEGRGIGLALAKRLVELMSGTIGYSTELGRGSTFWIELPIETKVADRSIPTALVSARPIVRKPEPVGQKFSLLYVEDNLANLRLIESLLSTLPACDILSASTPQLGIELALAHRPDVIILDLNLPGMSGFDVLHRLRIMPETRDVPVLALTAAASPNDIRRGLAAGFHRYMTKPIDVNSFFAAVEEAAAGSLAKRRRATSA